MMTLNHIINKNIARIMQTREISPFAIAQATEISYRIIDRIYDDSILELSIGTVYKISKHLNVSLDELCTVQVI